MSEEEKETIEDCKELVQELKQHKDKDFIGRLYYKNKPVEDILSVLLNLIEKQQKEIKDLKEKNEILTNITYLYNSYEVNNENKIIVADKEYFDSGLFVKRYISKDKVKEKIKDIDSSCELVCRFRNSFCEELCRNQQCITNEIRKVLKELLEV